MKRFIFILILICLFIVPSITKAEINNGLIAYYTFDGDVKDYSGNGYDGKADKGITFVDGVVGKAAKFDKYLQRIALPNDLLNGKDTTTVSFWIKIDKPDNRMGIISASNSSHDNEYLIFLASGHAEEAITHKGYLKYHFKIQGESNDFGTIKINDGKFHMITVVTTPEGAKCYVDGKLDAKIDKKITPFNIESKIWIGNDQDCVDDCWEENQQFYGEIDDLRFYNRALSQSEIEELYNSTLNPSTTSTGSNTIVTLSLSPQKSQYYVNDDISVLFSCSTDDSKLIGDVYIVFSTPQKQYFSITLNGIKQGILPFVKNVKISNVKDLKVFSFKYYDFFQSGGYKILSAIVKSNTSDIVSNIASIDIPGSSYKNNSPSIQFPVWNGLKTIWKDTYFRKAVAKAGNNYIHILLQKGTDYYYSRLDLNGYMIIPPYKLPFTGQEQYAPVLVADKDDNAYLISTINKNFYLLKISGDGTEEFNKMFYSWPKTANADRPRNLDAFIKDGKIYFVGEIPYLGIQESDYDIYHNNAILFGIVKTDGSLKFSPSTISGKVIEYTKKEGLTRELTYKSDDIITHKPKIVVDNNGIAHIFWAEKDTTLKTDYVLKYLPFNPRGFRLSSYIIGQMGDDYRIISVNYFDNTSLYVAYIDSTHSPKQLKILKISINDGKILKGPVTIPTENLSYSDVFILKDKFDNINIFYFSHSYKYHVSRVIVDSDLSTIKKQDNSLFGDIELDYEYWIVIDKNKNFHFVGNSVSSPYKTYYSNTNSDNSSFKNLPDILISPLDFKCSPSNNVDIGKSISCSFNVYNVSESSVGNGSVNVKINNSNILSNTFASIKPFKYKTITFQYSPTDINTPEYPLTEIKADLNTTELTHINNSISPKIRVRPVPTKTDFKFYVYDESLDPDHVYSLPRITDAVCSLYDTGGNLVASALLNKFKDIQIGESEANPASYILKCEKEGYNSKEKNISIWRDKDDPYKIDFSEKVPMKIYMNNWGTVSLQLSYKDDKGNEHELTGVKISIENDKFSKILNIDGSSVTFEKIPAGEYTIKVEKEDYSPVKFSANVTPGGLFSKEIITTPTDKGSVIIDISTTSGYLPVTATVDVKNGSNIVKTITVNNGHYEGELEKGSYTFTFKATDFTNKDVSAIIKAGLTNQVNATLEPKVPSNLKGYTRSRNSGIVARADVKEWPSTPLTDGFKVKAAYGLFTINTSFIGQESNNLIYSLNQLKIDVKGGPEIKASVSSTWDPIEIFDLPDNLAKAYEAYSALPMAITPEIPIKMTAYTGKTMVRIDKIVIKDDLGNTLFSTPKSFSMYSDNTQIFEINKILDKNSNNIIAEIYLKVGRLNEIENDFDDILILDGWGNQYLKLTYTVPREKPESGWSIHFNKDFYKPDYNSLIYDPFDPLNYPPLFYAEHKQYIPYKLIIEYVDTDYYETYIKPIPHE